MTIALIPARGGSKRAPRKNVRQVCGRPAIAWPIEAALTSGAFARVVVSTEDDEIAAAALAAGAETPARRPAALADDHTPLHDVVKHAIDAFGLDDDWICMIYATALLVRPETLSRAAAALDADADYALGVVRYGHPIQRALLLEDGRVRMASPENAMVRTQDLSPRFHDAAQFVFGARRAWLSDAPIWGARTLGVELPLTEAVDIDDEEDFTVATALLKDRTT